MNTSYSEMLDRQIRGEDVTPDQNNKVTQRRKNLSKRIRGNGKDQFASYQNSMSVIEDYVPRLHEYVISHSEEPAPDINDLIQQVYDLRQGEISDASYIMDYSNDEAQVHLEQQEADFFEENGHALDTFLGELAAPIEIARNYIVSKPEGIDLSGALGIVGAKIDKGALKRAAQDKPPGVLGFLEHGGNQKYNALRSYFKSHKDIAAKVISGEVYDESQLPGWSVSPVYNTGVNVLNDISANATESAIKRALPYVIGFVVVLILIVLYARSRSHK